MTAHTPSPWQIDPCLYGPHGANRSINGPHGEPLAMVEANSLVSAEAREANARLIAAAPALLEAVRQAALLNTVVGTDAWGLKTIAAALLATLDGGSNA